MVGRLAERPAAAAGRFYPGSPVQLRAMLDRLLAEAETPPVPKPLVGLVVPHAGFVYSGPTAAVAYRKLLGERFDRVVLLGPAHFVPVAGMATTSAARWHTPLGSVEIDTDSVERLAEAGVPANDAANEPEHSLEVQLPFLQCVMREPWTLVPVLVGHADAFEVASAIGPRLADPGTVLVVSTDLSHYLPYEVARQRDALTSRRITSISPDLIGDYDACGCYALRGSLALAAERGWRVSRLDMRNSGDTAGSKDRVVGYGAYAFSGGIQ